MRVSGTYPRVLFWIQGPCEYASRSVWLKGLKEGEKERGLLHANYLVHEELGKVVPPGIIAQPAAVQLTPISCDSCDPPNSKDVSHTSICKSLQTSADGRGGIKVYYSAIVQMGHDERFHETFPYSAWVVQDLMNFNPNIALLTFLVTCLTWGPHNKVLSSTAARLTTSLTNCICLGFSCYWIA